MLGKDICLYSTENQNNILQTNIILRTYLLYILKNLRIPWNILLLFILYCFWNNVIEFPVEILLNILWNKFIPVLIILSTKLFTLTVKLIFYLLLQYRGRVGVKGTKNLIIIPNNSFKKVFKNSKVNIMTSQHLWITYQSDQIFAKK